MMYYYIAELTLRHTYIELCYTRYRIVECLQLEVL